MWRKAQARPPPADPGAGDRTATTLSRLAEPLLRRRLTAEVAEEVALAKAYLERTG
ncbi:hypothetical protein [Streptomyces lydicus]|uniref:hypothetical protein n=1 Tax=Streptomyces lydicus TaxID=47763 RepID=UPI0036FD838A